MTLPSLILILLPPQTKTVLVTCHLVQTFLPLIQSIGEIQSAKTKNIKYQRNRWGVAKPANQEAGGMSIDELVYVI